MDQKKPISIKTAVFLEGPMDIEEMVMSTKLYSYGYLPGQDPKVFFWKGDTTGTTI